MIVHFLGNRDGNFAALTALAMVPVMAAVAGVVDYATASRKAGQLQNALDHAALSIAAQYYSGLSDTEFTDVGFQYVETNGDGLAVSKDGFDFHKGYPATDGEAPEGDYVTVRGTILHKSLFGKFDWPLERLSVVKVQPGQPACVLALDKTADQAVKIQGSTEVTLDKCVIASNSASSSSVYRGGSAKIAAECVVTVGGSYGLGGTSSVSLECPNAIENQYPSPDPLKNLVTPNYTACQSMPGGKSKTLKPGTYCGKTFSGDVVLDPGYYILRGGRIQLGGNGSLVGHGVTIFLLEGAEMAINANQKVELSPPDNGPYAGVTVYQEASNSNAVTINGTLDSAVSGFIYAPGAHIQYTGNASSISGKCLRLVGDTIEMNGTSDIASDCTAELGGRKMYAGRTMILVR
ncbi:TadE/TadG family type IV pilus assembly protein [Nitratireductor sp. ZSWI3]|uniref:TadE/TadG family type IV pilus assembly protein n=1 Tax=Nitratireductor sp. ZSWI3 TaxID=2966359 RepID=UPI0021501259|nr:TadE/TadG family type IV pilus assembly protein [Nitratireductor sp. ZSWI3]MCR4265253.1 pilus assembly protein [Nitratireductor sp. ZSWI3]